MKSLADSNCLMSKSDSCLSHRQSRFRTNRRTEMYIHCQGRGSLMDRLMRTLCPSCRSILRAPSLKRYSHRSTGSSRCH